MLNYSYSQLSGAMVLHMLSVNVRVTLCWLVHWLKSVLLMPYAYVHASNQPTPVLYDSYTHELSGTISVPNAIQYHGVS